MRNVIAYLAQIASLVRKELLAIFKDPANRSLLVAPALIQALLYGYGATYDLTNVPYAVLDQSRGAAATELVARLDGTGVFHRVETLATSDRIAGVIDENKALLVIAIPSDFEDRLASGRQAPLQVILDGRNSSTAGLAAAYVSSIVGSYNRSIGAPEPLAVVRRSWFNPNLESRWNMMPGLIASMSMIQTLMLAALSVAREREHGTFDQLLVTPLNPLQILIGKATPSILVGLIQSTTIFLIIRFWFRIPIVGSVPLLYATLFVFTLAAVGMGLCISAFARNMQQAVLYTFVLVIPMSLLSGLLTPVGNMPGVLQLLTYANPLRFGIDMVRRIYLEGAGFADIAPGFVPLVVMAAICLPVAAWLFRHRLA